MTGILGSGDPAFYYSDRDAAEAEHQAKIEFDDSFNKDGSRKCPDCERSYDPATMYDDERDGFIYKVCGQCMGDGHYSEKMPIQYESSPIPATNALGETL